MLPFRIILRYLPPERLAKKLKDMILYAFSVERLGLRWLKQDIQHLSSHLVSMRSDYMKAFKEDE